MWPENPAAQRGLRRAIRRMVEFELDKGHPHAAATLAAGLGEVPEDLARKIEAQHAERAERRHRIRELESLRADLDSATGQRTRAFVAAVLTALMNRWFAARRPAYNSG